MDVDATPTTEVKEPGQITKKITPQKGTNFVEANPMTTDATTIYVEKTTKKNQFLLK